MIVFLRIAGALAALYLLLTLLIFELAFRRFSGAFDPFRSMTHATDRLLGPFEALLSQERSWFADADHDTAYITARDGVRLCASVYENPAARGVLVACHGYRGSGPRDFCAAAHLYFDRGMTVVLLDQRAHGRSGGKFITFGVRESEDAQDWCRYAGERWPDKPVILAGISMGAGAVLLAADGLPGSVAALLADCGFSSPYEEVQYVAGRLIRPPVKPLVPGVALWCRVLGRFDLREKDARRALARTDKPVFFIHGEADELVPPSCSRANQAACAAPSALFTVPGAAHGLSYLADNPGYIRALDSFLRAHVPALADDAPADDTPPDDAPADSATADDTPADNETNREDVP